MRVFALSGARMPTLLSHPAVPLAIGLGLGSRIVPPRLLLVGVAACLVPDFDVFAFRFDLGYSNPLRHRGVTHSLFEASPIRLARFLDAAPRVPASELRWVWRPAVAVALAIGWVRSHVARGAEPRTPGG